MSETAETKDETGEVTASESQAEENAVEDDLDELLASSRRQMQESSESSSEQPKGDTDEIADLKAKVNALLATQQQNSVQDGLQRAIGTIAESTEALTALHDADPGYIEGQLRREAAIDPAVDYLFQNKDSDPQSWNKFLNGFAKKLDGTARKLAVAPSTSRASAEAAARGTSTMPEAPDLPDQSKLVDIATTDPDQWERIRRETYGTT